ncbi:plasminogen-like [Branchiostoma floridae]|uniref:Plasminogen-like n=1 Tax=Branchiostoma floridae TaxID=7739 RepID=A0A9J7MEB6_BRAFL|nr:plasminogen-like [Branchiostoma floridae]
MARMVLGPVLMATLVTVTSSKDCLEGTGVSYRGSLTVTWSGASCLYWDSPDVEDCGFSSSAFPQADLDSNYCRNPDGDVFPWCFYEVPSGFDANCTNWHYCDVQPCGGTME